MPSFSANSKRELETCHELLQDVMGRAIKVIDFTVLEGRRGQERQERLLKEGKTQLDWPESNHNSNPSLAVDVAPYPIDWKDRERFILLAGVVFGCAHAAGVRIRWGGDWDQDFELSDNEFDDLGHFELVDTSRVTTAGDR